MFFAFLPVLYGFSFFYATESYDLRIFSRFQVFGAVVHLEEFFLVEGQLCAGLANVVVNRRQFDGIDGAGEFAHTAINASEFVDLEADGIFFAIGPGRGAADDGDALGGTGRLAHRAGDAGDASLVVLVEPMQAAIIAVPQTALD